MKKHWQNIIFVSVCAAILAIFLMAPEGTTPRMPNDQDHQGHSKEYAKCFSCHEPDALPDDHTDENSQPPTGKNKCYFCHKHEKS
jgi:cytochrome c553